MADQSYRPEYFAELVSKHENQLYRTALAVTGNKNDAENIVQEVFLRAYEQKPDFMSGDHAKAWLLKVAINLGRSLLRSSWHKKTSPLLDSYPAASPQEEGLLEKVLALPAKYRTVIHLFYYEGYSIKEIARLKAQKESTIRSQLTRARHRLRSVLEEEADEKI